MTKVCIVGGGYAGVHAARTAARAGATVTVVDATGRHDFAPRLAAVAAGRRPAGDAWAPLESLVDGTVVADRVTAVDRDGPSVTLESGGQLDADAVVVTIGGRAQLPPVDGLDPHTAWTLRDAQDALRLRSALDATDRLVVVGGGATGVQLAAEVARAHPGTEVHLVEREDRLLPSHRRGMARRARAITQRRGVRLHLGRTVTRAATTGVMLDDGTTLEGTVVWATGVTADGNALLPDAATSDGRLVVDSALRVSGRVLAAGDVAATRDVFDRVTAPSAQIALTSGRVAGRNAALVARGRMPRPATLVDLGWVIDLGGRGVAQIGPLELDVPPLDLVIPALHEVTDIRHLWQAGGAQAVVDHATGQHTPTAAALRRAERPTLRSVG